MAPLQAPQEEREPVESSEITWVDGLEVFSLPLGTTNNLVAECWALREGLCMTRDIGVQSLIIELDVQISG